VPSRLGLVLPYLPVVGAGATIAVDLLGVPRIPVFELVMAVALFPLVLGRQFLATAENRRLLAELSAVHEQLRHQAMHDPLTGAANRSLFADRLQHGHAAR
jgi:diguanylate cyclase